MKLQFRVPYDTDLVKVKKIFKKIGAEMAADPVMGPNLLDPPKSQGVLEMDDSAMIIRCKFMAKPGEQFVIRRELFQRVQQEFEAAGIQFARRQVSVYVPPAAPGQAPEPEAVAAAAAAVEERRSRDPQARRVLSAPVASPGQRPLAPEQSSATAYGAKLACLRSTSEAYRRP